MSPAAGRARWLRSAGVRLAVMYAAVFGASALLLLVVLRLWSVNILTQQVDAAIEADANGLAEQWQSGGPEALLTTIQSRTAERGEALYLLLDPFGRRVAGNVDAWPPQVERSGQGYEVQVEREGKQNLARFQRYALPLGYALLIGREFSARAALRSLLTGVLAWSIVLIVLLSIAGALVLRQWFDRMVSHVAQTASAVAAGDLSRRVTITGRGDEFDRVAETINDMLDRLTRLMDGVRSVSNAIAHDLRTPIARARARLEDAAESGDPALLRAAIGRAIADLDGITAVFAALLRISEIEAGARRSAFVPLDAAPLLHAVAELYEPLAEESGIALGLAVAPALRLNGDRALIQQAVANLLDNAIKFSPAGSAVTLSGAAGDGLVRITVADRGPGIPPDDVGRASERFFRGEHARHTPGYGLGLTLVQAVAQLHGGALRLDPAEPGLAATLLLPAADAPALPAPPG